jgi:hypothetical protein
MFLVGKTAKEQAQEAENETKEAEELLKPRETLKGRLFDKVNCSAHQISYPRMPHPKGYEMCMCSSGQNSRALSWQP